MISSATQPRVLIIVLCFNGIADTLACLASLRQVTSPAINVLIVDNGSTDATPAQVRQHFPEVAVLETGTNLGFAAGNNVGLHYGLTHGYEYMLLLNNDTEVAADFLARLLEVAESDPHIGVVGPTIYYYERPDLVWSAGGCIDWTHGECSMRTNQPDTNHNQAASDVDFVTGCALLIRSTALEQAGMLDERFFMYFEETEWCVRIQRAGMRIVHVPDAKVWHKIPLNARSDKEYLAYYMTRNRLLFLQATHAPLRSWIHVILADMRTWLSLILRPKWRNRAGRIGMRMAWRDYWCGRFGMMPSR
jgi:GT2 family glycosyltransferase